MGVEVEGFLTLISVLGVVRIEFMPNLPCGLKTTLKDLHSNRYVNFSECLHL